MKEYEFALRFVVRSIEVISDELVEQLGDAGCDDALIGVGHAGRIAMEFARTSDSAHEAILSAIRDVRGVLPDAELVEVTPDIVGLTDVAEMVGCSRQNMRKLLVTCGTRGPVPIHEGASTLWHLAAVLNWLVSDKRYSIPDDLLGALRGDDEGECGSGRLAYRRRDSGRDPSAVRLVRRNQATPPFRWSGTLINTQRQSGGGCLLHDRQVHGARTRLRPVYQEAHRPHRRT